MEEKVNIAAILKDKPNGIRLYSPMFGECAFCYVREDTNDICVKKRNGVIEYFNYEGLYFDLGEVMLFPSKEMRDWSKFTWKKGDILMSDNGKVEVIFEKFVDDTYQAFIGKHHLDNLEDNLYYKDEGEYFTGIFNTESKDDAQTYVKILEKKLGGKLNRETLEVEKTQPEFKDGDSEKKQIVDLKPKFEFKPMDLCLMKYIGQYNNRGWELCQYAYTEHRVSLIGEQCDFYHAVGGEIYAECIPYNEDTKHLLGTRDEWKGGEG